MYDLEPFNPKQIEIINNSVSMAEDLVSNYYKMSAGQWLRPKYDIKTLVDLESEEIVDGPFAQIIRYKGQPRNSSLGSSTYDFYKICLQDHFILAALQRSAKITLFPFSLYIITHELIHIVRFSKFLQNFDASPEEMLSEEARVHHHTHKILNTVRLQGLSEVLLFYDKWRQPLDNFRNTW